MNGSVTSCVCSLPFLSLSLRSGALLPLLLLFTLLISFLLLPFSCRPDVLTTCRSFQILYFLCRAATSETTAWPVVSCFKWCIVFKKHTEVHFSVRICELHKLGVFPPSLSRVGEAMEHFFLGRQERFVPSVSQMLRSRVSTAECSREAAHTSSIVGTSPAICFKCKTFYSSAVQVLIFSIYTTFCIPVFSLCAI